MLGSATKSAKRVVYVSKQKSKSQSAGKQFEADFKRSVPSSSLLIRLNDSPQAFSKSKMTRFTHRTPCDFILFDGKRRILVPVELKTTKYKSISYEDVNSDDAQNRMIHKHQIVGLTKFSEYENVIAGFILNFRDEKNDCERCYFISVQDFNEMANKSDKCSCNELDILSSGGIRLEGEKRRVHYTWDIESLLDVLIEKCNR